MTKKPKRKGSLRVTTPKDLPRWGATKKQADANDRARKLKNQVFDLEKRVATLEKKMLDVQATCLDLAGDIGRITHPEPAR